MAVIETSQRQAILGEFYPASFQTTDLSEQLQQLQRAFPDVGNAPDISVSKRKAMVVGGVLLYTFLKANPAHAQSGTAEDVGWLRDLLKPTYFSLTVGGAAAGYEMIDAYFNRKTQFYKKTRRGSSWTETVANGVAGYFVGRTIELMAGWYATDLQRFVESLAVMSGSFGIVYVLRTKELLLKALDKTKEGAEEVADRVMSWWRSKFGGESEQNESEEDFNMEYEPGEDLKPPRRSSF